MSNLGYILKMISSKRSSLEIFKDRTESYDLNFYLGSNHTYTADYLSRVDLERDAKKLQERYLRAFSWKLWKKIKKIFS